MAAIESNAVVVDGVPTFYYARALSDGAQLTDVQQFAAGVEATGKGVVLGGPVVRSSLDVQPLKASKCGGVTKETSNWAGHTLYLNSCDANTVGGLAAEGGSATAVVGAVFAETGFGIPVAVLGGVIGVLGGWIQASNNRAQGVEIHMPYVGIPSVSSQ